MRVGAVARPLEGAARPGHFEGVATVVAVLLGLVRPDRAYFGMKDAQQLRVIARMATDLALTTVVPCPTVREPDGLAMSSRNVHLAPAERAAAAVLHRALQAGRRAAGRGRARRGGDPGGRPGGRWPTEPLADVEYVSLADDATLAELDRVDGPALLSLAVRFGVDAPHRQPSRSDRPGTARRARAHREPPARPPSRGHDAGRA